MTLEPQVVRLCGPLGHRNYLVFRQGSKFIHAITIDKQVRTVALPKSESRYFCQLIHKDKPYPPERAARRYLKAGKTLGITKSARAVLAQIKSQAL